MRCRAADRVERSGVDEQIEVGAHWPERVVAGRADLGAGLPPAVHADRDPGVESVVQPGAGAHPALRRLDRHPVAIGDPACLCRCGCSSTSGCGARLRRLSMLPDDVMVKIKRALAFALDLRTEASTVGMPVTRHPPCSPGRTVFPYPVPRLYSHPRCKALSSREHPPVFDLRNARPGYPYPVPGPG